MPDGGSGFEQPFHIRPHRIRDGKEAGEERVLAVEGERGAARRDLCRRLHV